VPERLAQLAIAAVGVPAALVVYIFVAERALDLLPARAREAARPWIWLAPCFVCLLIFLVYPSVYTLVLSLLDASASSWVGLANYRSILTDPAVLLALRNNAIWLVVFPSVTVLFGLAIAALTDRVRYESVAKAAVFLPMAISFVAAGVIWRFLYDFRPPPLPQIGTLNAFLGAVVPGFEPQAWLINGPLINNVALIAAAAWIWTGFCMVVLSAALKGVPVELLEAARADGASELKVFRHVTVPHLAPTIGVVTTTMVIFALKAFDIVYVMTNGNYDTDVIANRMYKELFNVHDFGRASSIAVLLLAAIAPIMVLNVRRFRQQEEMR
jgi:alpha-glucoside transport system permease protein